MARTPKTYRLSDDTLAYLQYLHGALPERSDTALVELAVSALVATIEHASMHSRVMANLSPDTASQSWVKGYDEGTRDALSRAGLSYAALVDAFERKERSSQ